ncbi:SPOR domain-containing protein [Falsiroseomonas sp. HW251]|uniref:SPOR domain-containing protein n=1 Tax=Falsiroseomonas sp. HW251 TaxID=3390998 RepID=UPI003D3160E7
MSDAVIPSYRIQREQSSMPWRLLAIAGALLGVAAIGLAGWWGWKSWGGMRSVPVVEAPVGPYKVRPDDPGGMRVPNQTEMVLERPNQRNALANQAARNTNVSPGAEAPDLGGLRAAVQPPPRQVVQPPAAVPAPAAPLAPPTPVAGAAPATAPPAPAQRVAAPSPTGRVSVQLGALPTEEAARAEWDRLGRRAPELFQGRGPQVLRLDRGDGQAPLFRLRTGGIADQEQATQFCEQVRARGANCVPVR